MTWSPFPDITPLINEVKELNKTQHKITALLEEQNQLLKQNLTENERENIRKKN